MKTSVVLSIFGLSCFALGAAAPVASPSSIQVIDPQVSGGSSPSLTITAQPQDFSVTLGQTATFAVTASATGPVTYQWTFNGINVSSNRSFYTRPSCQLSDHGAHVRVNISTPNGTTYSRTAILAVSPAGTTYYVAPSGSIANSGLSASSPWPMQRGLDQLGPGITVVALPGVYTGAFRIYYTSGTAANPATIRSQIKWQAVMANSPGRAFEVYSARYVVIDGFCVTNSVDDGIKLLDAFNTVRNCWVTHNGNATDASGISSNSTGTTNNVFEYNLIEYNGILPLNGRTVGYGHGIYFSGPNNLVRGNVVRYNGGFGIHLYTGYAGVRQNNNWVYSNLTYGHTNFYGVTMWGAVTDGSLPGTNYFFNNT